MALYKAAPGRGEHAPAPAPPRASFALVLPSATAPTALAPAKSFVFAVWSQILCEIVVKYTEHQTYHLDPVWCAGLWHKARSQGGADIPSIAHRPLLILYN